jgi:2-(1,2-epoxy-1,2-dihydrophenyl)acetyl-CoA isomerase
LTTPLILVTQNSSVRTLVLNRASALNSFNEKMHADLMDALDSAANDSQTRCVILTGAGRAFCVGQDLADPLVAPETGASETGKNLGEVVELLYNRLAQRIRTFPTPVIAAVNGVAAGAGVNIALNCDMVLSVRSANFIQAFVKIGLIPDTGGTWLLPRLVGRARAIGLVMLGEKLSAIDAERFGLIWRCVDDNTLMNDANDLGQLLASMPTQALVATRMAFDAAQHLTFDAAISEEARVQTVLGFAHDYREGVAAFTAKRQPKFTDR